MNAFFGWFTKQFFCIQRIKIAVLVMLMLMLVLLMLVFGLMLVFVSSNQSNLNAFKCKQTIEYHLFKMFFLFKFNWPESYFWNLNIQYNNKVKSNKYSLSIKLIFKILFNFKFPFKSFITSSFYIKIKTIE